jgi:hypothetical protein
MPDNTTAVCRTLYGVRKGDLWINPSGRFDDIQKRRLWNRIADAKSALTRSFPDWRYKNDPFKLALEYCDAAVVEVFAEEKTVQEYPVGLSFDKWGHPKVIHSTPKKEKKGKT